MLSTLFLIFFFVSLSRQQILSYQIHSILSILFFIFFKKVFLAFVTMQRINFHAYHPPTDKRRRRDLNPRAAINDLLPFQGSPFGQLGYFSKLPYAIAFFQKRFILYRVVFYLSRTFLTFQKFFILFK